MKKEELEEGAESQIEKVLDQLRHFVKSPTPTNEENLRKGMKRMSKENQLTLLKACHSLEVKGPEVMESLFEPAVHKMFSTDSQRTALYGLVKEDRHSSTKLKVDVLEAFEPKGCLTKITLALEKKCSQSVKVTLVMIKGVLGATIGLLSIPLQDTKDLVSIICLKIFQQTVIQGRIELIDNMPLEEFITTLGVIYGLQFIVRQMNSVASRFASSQADSHSCYIDVFRCHLNPYWIPFVREIIMALQRIQATIAIFRKKSAMDEMVEKLDALEGEGERTKAWREILETSLDIENEHMHIETLGERRTQLKIISTVGDLLQGSILTILLLRPDLRVRSMLKFSSLSGYLGLNVREFGALGNITSQELRMLSSVTINCQITKIVMNSGSQLSEL